MSRKRNRRGFFGDTYWQSADLNQRTYQLILNQMIDIALARFQWLNLPSTCDARFLNYVLLFNGIATIATPKKPNSYNGYWFSTQCNISAPINVYDNPTKWQSFGNNGWSFNCDASNAVLIYDDMNRTPLLPLLEFYAREIADVLRTKQINRQHQKTPYILTGTQDQQLDLQNIYKQIAGGEPAIIGLNGLNSLKPDVLKTGVPFIGNELHDEILNYWQLAFTAMGVTNLPFKSERQVEGEVRTYAEPSELNALASLAAMREGVNQWNERFNPDPDKPLQVVWAQDWQSLQADSAFTPDDEEEKVQP